MSDRISKVTNGKLTIAAILGFIGASNIPAGLEKEIFCDINKDRQNHPKVICNPNDVKLGQRVKFRSHEHGWRIGILVAIFNSNDGRIRLREKLFVNRKLHLLFPVN